MKKFEKHHKMITDLAHWESVEIDSESEVDNS
jgi:hypothetical protein